MRSRKLTKKCAERLARETADALERIYPDAECALVWKGDPWKLLVMGRLSAQCTDKKVNAVSEPLFEKYQTPEAE